MNVPVEGLAERVIDLLEEIQVSIYNKARTFRDEHITEANTWEEFVQLLDEKTGFIAAHWDGTPETEDLIKEKTKATIRCIPLKQQGRVRLLHFDRKTKCAKGSVCTGILIERSCSCLH